MTTTPNPKREKQLKVPLNDNEDAALRKFCTSIGRHVAPFVRDLAFAHIRAEVNRTAGKRKSEWPRHGHMQRFPGRAAVAGGLKRLHL
jgi:hypothetical protein